MESFQLDFIGVGPQRTGTSWLDQVLRQHPGLCLPQHVKETHYFAQHDPQQEPDSFARYQAHFVHCEGNAKRGEISATYFDDEAAPERIYNVSSDCNIIVNLRDPAERAFSLYCLHLSKGRVSGSFSEAAAQMPHIIDSSHYARYIPRWIDRFGKEKVLFLLLEDIESAPDVVFGKVCRFLSVNETALPDVAREKVGSATLPKFPAAAKIAARGARWLRAHNLHRVAQAGKMLGLRRVYTGAEDKMPTLSTTDRAMLVERYQDDIIFVEHLLERDLLSWRSTGPTAG